MSNNKSKDYKWDDKKGLIWLTKPKTTKVNKPKDKKDEIKEILKAEIINMLTEEVTYNFPFKNKQFKIRFDVNANPTKKGLKIQFIPTENLIQDQDSARQLINELQIFLNQKLATIGMAADFDPDVPYQNVIGFTIKLGSISNMMVKALGATPNPEGDGQGLPKVGKNNLNQSPDEKTKIN